MDSGAIPWLLRVRLVHCVHIIYMPRVHRAKRVGRVRVVRAGPNGCTALPACLCVVSGATIERMFENKCSRRGLLLGPQGRSFPTFHDFADYWVRRTRSSTYHQLTRRLPSLYGNMNQWLWAYNIPRRCYERHNGIRNNPRKTRHVQSLRLRTFSVWCQVFSNFLRKHTHTQTHACAHVRPHKCARVLQVIPVSKIAHRLL